MTVIYFLYWGKAQNHDTQTTCPHHLLPYHSLDVAAVALELLAENKPLTHDLANFLELSVSDFRKLIGFIIALHDLGKFASAFQALYQHDRLHSAQCRYRYNGYEARHDRLGIFFWNELKKEHLLPALKLETLASSREQRAIKNTLKLFMECSLGHHGKPIQTQAIESLRDYTEPHNIEAAAIFLKDIAQLFEPNCPLELFQSKEWQQKVKQISWHLAGIIVLADWIGSDQTYFPYCDQTMPLEQYWQTTQQRAKTALKALDINQKPTIKPFQSIQEHYGFHPTPLQQWAESVKVDNSPQLFILEDVTGSGKTEAALTLTHRLLEAGAADGFYFGLPTMATSNAMFQRIAHHYTQMLTLDNGKAASIVLAHGASKMNDQFREAILNSQQTDNPYDQTDNTATTQCNQWLADSRKKALLAPVGVGTIDQALLAVLPRRHQSLRLLGLNRKVLVFDEVHAADEYMLGLLNTLLATHVRQGGSVILLTATLAHKQRQRLVNCWQSALRLPANLPQQNHFPLATYVSTKQPLNETPINSRAEVSRTVRINFLHTEQACIQHILTQVEQGHCIVWIRNSVDDVLQAYQQLQTQLEHPEHCIVFHSRFILSDRKRIENNVLNTFGKSSEHKQRQGRVLICSQVFQESLDADADCMISDICPIDDLIQRAGRLQRHTRNSNRQYQPNIQEQRPLPELWIHAPEWEEEPSTSWLSQNFRNTQYVYGSVGRLWLGMRKLRELGVIKMPEHARELIETVYGESSYEQIPTALESQEQEELGKEHSYANKAYNQVLNWEKGYCLHANWFEDEGEIGTRLVEIEQVNVLLLKRDESGELTPWVNDQSFAIALSTVKLGKTKYADHLSVIDEGLQTAFVQKYPQARYLQLWLPDDDEGFAYDANLGVYEKSPR